MIRPAAKLLLLTSVLMLVAGPATAQAHRYVLANSWTTHLNVSSIAIDQADNVIVSDTSQNRVFKFTSSGQLINSWGGTGTGNGQFNFPFGVATDSAGDVYVSDTSNH